MDITASVVVGTDDQGWQEAQQSAGAFPDGSASPADAPQLPQGPGLLVRVLRRPPPTWE